MMVSHVPADWFLLGEGSIFPHLNACLNGMAAFLLVTGVVLIKQKKESAHKFVMISCFFVSCVFLCSYLYYHIVVQGGESTKFPRDAYPTAYWFYLPILGTHTILAASVPFLAGFTIYFGLKDKRSAHRRVAKITFPIWLYVSITGVIVYLMLYQLFLP